MDLSPPALLGLLLWAGLCAADSRALGSRGFHQPIVAAAGAGLLLHCPERALVVGLWLQLVWAAPMPVGGVVLPDTGAPAVAGTAFAALWPGPLGLVLAIVAALIVAAISVPWERSLRAVNGRREISLLGLRGSDAPSGDKGSNRTGRGPDAGNAQGRRVAAGLTKTILHGVAGPFLQGVLLTLIILAICGAIVSLVRPVAGSAGVIPAIDNRLMEQGLIGGAACFGIAALYLRLRSEGGRWGPAWLIGGFALGLAGRLLLVGGRG